VSAFTVREARDEELDAAGALVVEAYLAGGVLDPSNEGDMGYADHIRDARWRARHCPILVAVEEGSGTLLGCVTYVPGPGNRFAELEADGEAGFRMLGVSPRAQRRGVARALVAACVERARAAGRHGLAISTGPDMAPAHRLYEGLGFRRAPERDFEPAPGIRLVAFVLPL
jgi:ribosomal protein S18 acetylase RimI-like enzyme